MLTARTLAEAQVYVSLMVATDGVPPDAMPDAMPDARQEQGVPGSRLAQGQDAWTLSYGDGAALIEVEVPYASEQSSRRAGARFGLGVSQLVDAGQWVLLGTTYARRALDADLALDAASVEQRRRVEVNWEFAAEALAEAVRFLPEGAAEVPPEAFWSELGTRTRNDSPELFTRERLLDDLAYYRDTLADFRSLHGPSA